MARRTLPEPDDDTDRGILDTIARDGWAVPGIAEDDDGSRVRERPRGERRTLPLRGAGPYFKRVARSFRPNEVPPWKCPM